MVSLRERLNLRLEELRGTWHGHLANRRVRKEPTDPRAVYPGYRSFDEDIDVERLKGLDEFLKDRIAAHLRRGDCAKFSTGNAKGSMFARRRPGSRIIHLTRKTTTDYFDLDKPEVWHRTPAADDFAPLMEFVDTLPFKGVARVIIMCDDRGRRVTEHRDHTWPDLLHEFVWFRSNLDKRFYLRDNAGRHREYVESYSAWFDTVNQLHGAEPSGDFTFSMRVDGVFSDALRARIPRPSCNRACTPTLWASVGDAVSGM
ncbi:MAG: hypothetical protein AAF628_14415 [Planctomycetota bacterium]